MKQFRTAGARLAAAFASALVASQGFAVVPPQGDSAERTTFRHPDLYVRQVNESVTRIPGLAASASFARLGSPAESSFVDLRTSGGSNALDGNPFGSFEAGAALGGKFLGGGSPSNGIAVGDEATFVFNVTGADAADLTVEDFLGQTSAGNQDNSASFLVRFRGINFGAGSDKVPGTTVAVPLPPAVWTGLATLGLAGFASIKRRALRPTTA